jgi:hypothetical protein
MLDHAHENPEFNAAGAQHISMMSHAHEQHQQLRFDTRVSNYHM